MEDVLVNKVAQSGIITFNLEDYYHTGDRVVLDIKDQLFMGLILKKKISEIGLKTMIGPNIKTRILL
jgi:hypothetical protein